MNRNPQPDDDNLEFLPELPETPLDHQRPPWKVMVVDDEPGVHASTRLALRGITFRDRELEFIDAYSGAEALRLLEEHDDVAVVFLDVVMESDDAGLVVARRIRENGHLMVRIVLRTGHPGYAPEREVVVNYDIHDYKEKSNLDFSKLFSCLISALRAHDDLVAIERHRRGLISVLEAVSWFDFRSLQRYLAKMVAELSTLANVEISDLLLAIRTTHPLGEFPPTTGAFDILIDGIGGKPMDEMETAIVTMAFSSRGTATESLATTLYCAALGVELVLFTRDEESLATADRTLLEIFLHKVAQTLDNHGTFCEILRERDSMVRGFANLGSEWGGHANGELEVIQRLAREIAARLRQQLQFSDVIDDWFVFSIGTAAGFHDIGIATVPHRLLEKPGTLDTEEVTLVREHVRAGVELLRKKLAELSGTRLFTMTEDVVMSHHERQDGSGYPEGRVGDDISVAARIVAVVDTFVAMTNARPYRPAYPRQQALEFIRHGRGAAFDARVVDAFLEVVEEFR